MAEALDFDDSFDNGVNVLEVLKVCDLETIMSFDILFFPLNSLDH